MTELEIERLNGHGDGVARDGVFAPFTLPGERISGEIADGRIAAAKIVSPSDDRIAAPCRHFRSCGGCALQHGSDDFVAGWKRGQIAFALKAQGVEGYDLRETATSPTRSRRRATFTARRTKKGAIVGFHGRRASDIVALSECHVVHEAIFAAIPAIEAAARIAGSRKGELRAVATLTDGGVDLSMEGGKALDRQVLISVTALAEAHDLARLSWDGEVLASRRAPALKFGAADVAPAPGGFLQATAHGERILTQAALAAIGSARRVADLFSGCGTFALPAAARAEVHAVESDAAALDALIAGANRAQGLKKVTVERRDLFRRPMIAPDLKGLDAVIIDPPRAGAAAQSEALAADGPAVIAAISCNPVTFARDARTLIDGGYRLDWVQPVDQFRWSPHVELAARFYRD